MELRKTLVLAVSAASLLVSAVAFAQAPVADTTGAAVTAAPEKAEKKTHKAKKHAKKHGKKDAAAK